MSTGARRDAPTRHPRDIWGSAATIAVAAVALERSVSYGFKGKNQLVGPGLFPAIVAAALLLAGAAWAWQTWRSAVPESEEPIEWPDAGGTRRILLTAGALLAAGLLFDVVDFRLTIFAVTVVLLRFVFGRSLLLSAALGVVLAVICYLGLALGLGMVLPVFRW
ncbi:tripartite tricarboxylate transporter TctB family protein [Micromonospora sp. NPDC092111]|uniref:tripartite tricarboxylate transporter TctB family protein n=1 Tax=Micromonospora sp. NPDC092111 TaxID=3364289 RepID=UPI00382D2A81